VHSFCLELMPDFQPTSEVTYYIHLFFDQAYFSLLIMIFWPPFAEYSTCLSSQGTCL
jgi:hypothetical protein